VAENSHINWKRTGSHCNTETNERVLRLLEFASYNSLSQANTFGANKNSRKWAWHHRNGKHHNQIDYIFFFIIIIILIPVGKKS